MKPPSNEPARSAPESGHVVPDPNAIQPERRQDPVTRLWHVLAAGRCDRPQELLSNAEFQLKHATCDFCGGNESQTTPTLAWFHTDPDVNDELQWQVRVVENLFPAFVDDDDDDPSRSLGRHRVIIESREHVHSVQQLSDDEVELVFRAYRAQYRELSVADAIRYAIIFKNQGELAGMSREHIHSQLVALPTTPPIAMQELAGAEDYFRRHECCVFCKMAAEATEEGRVVAETDTMIAYCPYASRTAYEVWIQPKQHAASFEAASDIEVAHTAMLIRPLLDSIQKARPANAYNYLIHSAPFDITRKDHYHWHIEIIPRANFLAGLEFGTGLMINTVAPEVAAAELRQRLSKKTK